MKAGTRIPTEVERRRTAIESMVNGSIGGHSRIGMPVVQIISIPFTPEAPAWAPEMIGGAAAVWIADDIGQADLSDVASWTDRVSSFDLVQPTSAYQPIYQESGTGFSFIKIPGPSGYAGEFMYIDDEVSTALSGHVFVVAKPYEPDDRGCLVRTYGGAPGDFDGQGFELEIVDASGSDLGRMGIQSPFQTTGYVGDDTLGTTRHLLEWSSDGSAWGMRLDGATQTLTLDSGGGSNNGDWFGDYSRVRFQIGKRESPPYLGSNVFYGEISEVIVVDGAISGGDRTNYYEWVTERYGITLP